MAAILDRIDTILAIFDPHPDASYQVSSRLAFRFRRGNKKNK